MCQARTQQHPEWLFQSKFFVTNESNISPVWCHQPSCVGWGPGGERERSGQAVERGQRVRTRTDVLLRLRSHCFILSPATRAGFRRSGRWTTTCTSTPGLSGAGATSPPTRGWWCTLTGRGWTSPTSGWVGGSLVSGWRRLRPVDWFDPKYAM